jgi:hypothetical protein
MIGVVTERFQSCPKCGKSVWRGRRRFGPPKMSCRHCGAPFATGLRDWNAMPTAKKILYAALDWFFPAYYRGMDWPAKQVMFFTHIFLIAIPMLPVGFVLLAIQSGKWDTLIPALLFLLFTAAHALWLLRRIKESAGYREEAAPASE